MRNKYLLLLLILPFIVHAEGQEGLVVILDGMFFIMLFAICVVIVFQTIKQINKSRTKKLPRTTTYSIILISGLIIFFVWSMIKSDSQPFDGPIDSIINKEENQLMMQNATINDVQDSPDSTIEETISAIDTSEIGIYIWLNHKRVFVRKNRYTFYTQRQEDSLTMSIVRRWKMETKK